MAWAATSGPSSLRAPSITFKHENVCCFTWQLLRRGGVLTREEILSDKTTILVCPSLPEEQGLFLLRPKVRSSCHGTLAEVVSGGCMERVQPGRHLRLVVETDETVMKAHLVFKFAGFVNSGILLDKLL